MAVTDFLLYGSPGMRATARRAARLLGSVREVIGAWRQVAMPAPMGESVRLHISEGQSSGMACVEAVPLPDEHRDDVYLVARTSGLHHPRG